MRSINYSKFVTMQQEIKYRWIYRDIRSYKNSTYIRYVVQIKRKHMYSSTVLNHCVDFIFNYAKKNNICQSKILKNANTRITKNC